LRHRLFGESSPADVGDYAIAGLKLRDAFTNFFNDACNLRPRGKGEFRLDLVFSLDDERIGKFTPQALTRTTTSPIPGFGGATSSMTRLSGGPYCLHNTAVMKIASGPERFGYYVVCYAEQYSVIFLEA